MSTVKQHSFWSSSSPLGGLAGVGLLVIASARLSWAITVSGSLFWVYGLSAFSYAFLSGEAVKKFFPASGHKALYTCLCSFWGSLYLIMFWLLCPFAAFEVFIPLMLVPLFCAGMGSAVLIDYSADNQNIDIFDNVSEAVSQAVTLSGLLITFSIIREPLSYSSLSFPGTYQGMFTVVDFKSGSFFPIGIFAPSSGALLLLGYFMCLYQYCKSAYFPGDKK